MAADLGCSLSQIGERIPAREFPLWLARYVLKLGGTYDQEKIKKAQVDSFMEQARAHWKSNP